MTLRVRHSTPDEQSGRSRYLTGVEFVDVTPALEEFLVRQVAVRDRQSAGRGLVDDRTVRRSPQVAPRRGRRGGTWFAPNSAVRVRLLDISAAGALLQTDERLPLGGVGKLRLSLGGAPFETTVEVKREEPAPELRGRVAGTFIVAVQPREQDALEEFLRRAGS